MSSKFLHCDRDTLYLMPPSIQEWLPEKHIARFIVEIIEKLDLSAQEAKYSSIGRKAYPVRVMVGLLFYGYITGIYSSRKIENATYESVPFRYVAANFHPDHASISEFRKEFIKELGDIFHQILSIAAEMKILKMGNVSTDGSKIKANASKHKALSYDYAIKLDQQLRNEVAQLMKMAESADAEIPQGMDIPEELARREKRLEVIDAAKKEIEERAKKRFEIEQAEYDEKMADRKKEEERTGKKKSRKGPKPPVPGPRKKDQVNLTDAESRIMPKSGGGFVQAYNAQISVDIDSLLIVAQHVTQHTNDKLEIAPTLKELKKTEAHLGQKCDNIMADTGYFSTDNAELCVDDGINPLIADKRDRHNKTITERFEYAGAPPENADAVTRMKHQLKTKEGKALYAKRKSTVEPVFGIIKNVMNIDTFLLRGLKKVQGEWTLITMAWNLKRMFVLQP